MHTITGIAGSERLAGILVVSPMTAKKAWQLFDLNRDPSEKTDLAIKQPEIVRELDASYDTWWKSIRPQLVNEDVLGPDVNPFKAFYNQQFGIATGSIGQMTASPMTLQIVQSITDLVPQYALTS